jgi:LmbE family N-acetylglucosaminyl deacetylase
MKRILLFVGALLLVTAANSQENRLAHQQPNTAEIYHNIEKLGFLGTALYLAAHPDDENTRLISWLANEKMARTAYLSLTRGDGGQNLIGPELREQLGMIRTQELLEARHRDGGEQFFTRANDFGYSKHPDETLNIWNKDAVLNDVVTIMRKLQPDVIINRFNHRTPGTTHGHHTSSAILSMEAFDKVSDPNYKTPQVQPWSPERVFFNTSWWFYGSEEAFEKADKTNLIEINAGSFYNYLGMSNNEIAALSRSEHKSQGFGSSGSRGKQIEYLEYLKGSFPSDKNDLFSGINTTWTRVNGGSKVQELLDKVIANYDFKDPEKSLFNLFKMRHAIDVLEDYHWKEIKTKELNQIILDIVGFYAEASVSQTYITAGETAEINLETTNRSGNSIDIKLLNASWLTTTKNSWTLEASESQNKKISFNVPKNAIPTTPYYLMKEGTLGMYRVDNTSLIGKPETAAAYQIVMTVLVMGKPVTAIVPVIHKRTDPVRGEINEPLRVVPAVSVAIENPVYIFNSGQTKEVEVTTQSFTTLENITLALEIPAGWQVTTDQPTTFNLARGQLLKTLFKLTAPAGQSEAYIKAVATVNGTTYDQEVITLDYNHIPNQQLIWDTTAKVVNPDLKNSAATVAYINGAGDDVATAIEAMGSMVFKFDPNDLPADLSPYDAVVVGIRAYNVAPQEMANLQPRLDDYVQGGGTLVMQYNTNRGIRNNDLGPLTIALSRKRVTDERATVTLLATDHPVLNTPNQITTSDFEGWVQERGLYFPDAWNPAFTPILGMNDSGDSMTTGSLIVAQYGKGHVVYTGLSFFRELPAGVSGAYRLLANMISLGQEDALIENTPTDGKQ